MSENPFPICERHNVRVCRGFPPECPLGSPDAHAELLRLKDRSFWTGNDDPAPAVATDRVYKVCSECVPRLLGHPHIGFLRRQKS